MSMSHSHTAHTIKSEKPASPTSSEHLEPCELHDLLLGLTSDEDGLTDPERRITSVAPTHARPHTDKDQVMKDVQKVQLVLNEKVEIARKHYLDPAQEYLVAQADARPIMTSLLGVFFALSFFPVLTFVLFSLGAILTVGGTALVISLAILTFVIGTAVTLLIGTLFVTGFLSLCALGWVLSVYALVRLGQNLLHENNTVEGLKSYYAEMHGLVFGTHHQPGRSEGGSDRNNVGSYPHS